MHTIIQINIRKLTTQPKPKRLKTSKQLMMNEGEKCLLYLFPYLYD